MNNMDEIWWRQINSASSFLDSIVTSLLEFKSVIMVLPNQVPWYDKMAEIIEQETILQNSNHFFDCIDAPQDIPGKYLLNKYCRREIQARYRPSMKYADFLAGNEEVVLHSRYVWVRNIPENRFEEWANFVAEYSQLMSKKHQKGAFLLEVSGSHYSGHSYKGVQTISFEAEISEYDKTTFSMLAASNSSLRTKLKSYLAELTSKISKEDIELCALCSQKGRAFLENPKKVIVRIVKEEVRSDGSNYQYDLQEEQIKQAIWETQIKLIFPIIETFRMNFVRQYEAQIQRQLPIATNYGEEFQEAREVEIGTLNYMVTRKQIIVMEKDQRQLERLKNARNALAHLRVLTLNEVEEIWAFAAE